MKKLLSIFSGLSIVLVMAISVSAQAVNVTGDWDLKITSPQGTRDSKASLKQEGEKLTGVFKGARGELPVQGSIKGKEIKLTYTVKFQDQELPITLTGTVDGDSMKGAADFGGFAQGDWSGARSTGAAASAAPAAAQGEKIEITGAWVFEVVTEQGSGSPTFNFKQDGEKLTGKYKGAFGESDLTGTVKGAQVEFSFKVSGQIDGTLTYSGTSDGKTIKGKVVLAGLGEGTFTGKKQ